MQKIYVLLSNDQQTGPYSLEEIIQFDLKPYDLIWIQGGSTGWYYPQEIAALHPYLAFLPKKQAPVAEARPPFVSMPSPGYTAETSAVAASFSSPVTEEPVYKAPPAVPAALEEAVFAQFRNAPEKEAFISTPQTTVTAKKKAVSPVLIGITTVLIVGGVFAASWMLNRGDKAATHSLGEVVSNFPVQEEIREEEKQTAVVSQSASTPQPQRSRRALAVATTQIRSGAKPDRETATVASEPSFEMEEEPVAAPPDGPPATIRTENEAEARSGGSETAAPQEKKKKLRDKIFDIFRKKPEEAKGEEAGAAETSPGERSSSRREEGANLTQMVHVRFTVPNEWMMGIHGAKATLVNRGSEMVQKAIIEVQYFDDDNQLLQKKIISFEKVGGKDSKTIAIPDHPTATKVDYSVVSASGKPAA